MKLLLLILLFLTGCATVRDTTFTVDQFLGLAIEYDATGNIAGADTLGPTDKEAVCEQGSAEAIAAAPTFLEPGHHLAVTCLHIDFGGPLPKGAAVIVPVKGTALTFVIVAVAYTSTSDFIGATPMHATPDPTTCMHDARDVLKANIGAGKLPAGASLLLYCVPVPRMPSSTTPGGAST